MVVVVVACAREKRGRGGRATDLLVRLVAVGGDPLDRVKLILGRIVELVLRLALEDLLRE